MKITIIGYGKMGKAVEAAAIKKGIQISAKYDSSDEISNHNPDDSAAIDFTTPEAFKSNYKLLSQKFNAVVAGTTGWDNIKSTVEDTFRNAGKSFIYGGNFSIGVNLFFNVAELLASAAAKAGKYEPYIIEKHHSKKLDSPSGTAKIIENSVHNYYNKDIHTSSVRAGEIKGYHELGFESADDSIKLIHNAYSRDAFAEGALLAAEWAASGFIISDFYQLFKEKYMK